MTHISADYPSIYRFVMHFTVLYIIAFYRGCLIERAPLVKKPVMDGKNDVALRTIEMSFANAILYQSFQMNGLQAGLV